MMRRSGEKRVLLLARQTSIQLPCKLYHEKISAVKSCWFYCNRMNCIKHLLDVQ